MYQRWKLAEAEKQRKRDEPYAIRFGRSPWQALPPRLMPKGPRLERLGTNDPKDLNDVSVVEDELLHPEKYVSKRGLFYKD